MKVMIVHELKSKKVDDLLKEITLLLSDHNVTEIRIVK